MSGAVVTAGGLVVAPVFAACGGSVLAARRTFRPVTLSAMQHLAAGVVTAAVAGEVLPDLRDRHSMGATVAGFVVGLVVIIALARFERRQESMGASRSALPIGMLGVVVIDLLVDGVLVGVGAAVGEAQGRVLTIALTVEILLLALTLTGELRERGMSTRRAALVPALASAATVVGAVVGAAALAGARSSSQAAVLAFGSAALLYLATEELLVEAHESADSDVHVILFFVGFVALFVLEGIA